MEHEAEESPIPWGKESLQEEAIEILWGKDPGLAVAFDFHLLDKTLLSSSKTPKPHQIKLSLTPGSAFLVTGTRKGVYPDPEGEGSLMSRTELEVLMGDWLASLLSPLHGSTSIGQYGLVLIGGIEQI